MRISVKLAFQEAHLKVASDTAYPPPPEGLSPRLAAIWTQLGPTRAKSQGRRVIFEEGLRSLGQVHQARDVWARDGMVVTSERSGVVHLHPAAKLEKDAMATFLSCWRALGLEWDARIDGGGL